MGSKFVDFGFVVSDLDVGDMWIYKIVGGDEYGWFSIDVSIGIL